LIDANDHLKQRHNRIGQSIQWKQMDIVP